uniref:Uncharacterized protein n=1 Tax=Trypanosoma vivax (strain Y486) TaxID=1055687 RepID=G0TSK3_TRYVY|nr:hypothetical protein TVY486_0301200 [Trypanosoma vivax Y486]
MNLARGQPFSAHVSCQTSNVFCVLSQFLAGNGHTAFLRVVSSFDFFKYIYLYLSNLTLIATAHFLIALSTGVSTCFPSFGYHPTPLSLSPCPQLANVVHSWSLLPSSFPSGL